MIKEFLKKQILDIRVQGKIARPFDQKLTPDVVYTVCSVIYEFTKKNKIYKNKQIINSDIMVDKVIEEFGKPAPDGNTKNEYDKFVGQTTQMLVYSGIVHRVNFQEYEVIEYEILNSIIEKNIISTIDFLYIFFEEVFKQSSFFQIDNYTKIKKPSQEDYILLRDSFVNLIHTNTKIQKNLEPRRIIAKPLNLIAYKRKSYGVIYGSVSKRVILLTDILYARVNSRDSQKSKNIPRKIAKRKLNYLDELRSKEYKVKRFVKILSNNLSDVSNEYATQAHHILPKSKFPEFIATPENIIILTPNEHYLKAHPKNNTQIISKDYQLILLKIKKEIILNNPNYYNFNVFNNMLSKAKLKI